MLVGACALAQVPEVEATPREDVSPSDSLAVRAQVQLRYGVSLREGAQTDSGPGLTYDGMTPNDLSISASYFPLLNVGFGAQFQREAFTLLEQDRRVTGGGLIRAGAGPVGRISFGPVRLELLAGYGFAQLAAFDDSVDPEFRPVTRHAVLLASRAAVALPLGIRAEVHGSYPIALATTDGGGQAASSSGFTGGGGLSFRVLQTGTNAFRLGADYEFTRDEANVGETLVASQQMQRIGANLSWELVPEGAQRRPALGGLRVQVIDEGTRAPLGEAAVTLQPEGGAARELSVGTPEGGTVEGLSPGPVALRATAPGYLPAEVRAQVAEGVTTPIQVALRKEPPTVGALSVQVTHTNDQSPIAGAVVTVGAQQGTTDEAGVARFESLPPGPVEVSVKAEGFNAGEEVAQIVAGRVAELPLALVPEKQAVPATLTGIVRNTAGRPLAARLRIPGLSLEIQADEQGAFSQTIPAGSYRVIISAPGYRTQVKQVTVGEGDQAIFNVDLHPRR